MADNIKMRLEGNKLIVEIDISKDLGPSKSGKTNIVATTRGNKSLAEFVKYDGKKGDIKLGINCYK